MIVTLKCSEAIKWSYWWYNKWLMKINEKCIHRTCKDYYMHFQLFVYCEVPSVPIYRPDSRWKSIIPEVFRPRLVTCIHQLIVIVYTVNTPLVRPLSAINVSLTCTSTFILNKNQHTTPYCFPGDKVCWQ